MSLLSRLFAWLASGRSEAPAAPAGGAGVGTFPVLAGPAISPEPVHQPAPIVPVLAVGDPSPPASHLLWRGGVPPEVFDLSEAFEAYRPAPYRDSGGVWTFGIGSTRDLAGRPVSAVTPSVSIAEARQMAARDLAHAADLAARCFPAGLPPRWGAVAILTSNNMGNMLVWGETLHRLLLAANWRGAAEQLRAYRNAKGVPQTGLRRRRWAEAAYAMGMDAAEARRLAWSRIQTPDDWPPLPG